MNYQVDFPNSDQLKDAPIMISISFLAFIFCRSTVSKPNLARSDLLLEGKLNSRTKFRGAPFLIEAEAVKTQHDKVFTIRTFVTNNSFFLRKQSWDRRP